MKKVIFFVCLFLVVISVLIMYSRINLYNRSWIESRTDFIWPHNISNLKINNTFWLFSRAESIKVYFEIPSNSIDTNMLHSFYAFDNSYVCNWSPECEKKGLSWYRWQQQKIIFGNPPKIPKWFINVDVKSLNDSIYYKMGDVTGFNRYIVCIDKLTGKVWITIKFSGI